MLNQYCNPLNLVSIKSLLYSNPITFNFQDKNIVILKSPGVKIQPLFLQKEIKNTDVVEKLPYLTYPHFMNQGIPENDLNEFTLKNSNEIPERTEFQNRNLELHLDPDSHRKIFKKEIEKNYARQVILNEPCKEFKELIPNPAWEWPFELDMFQKKAILALEDSKSVFVAAHTSAGKTVVAEYAIAMCHNRGARVIYTSPIKALSNQKYREFKVTFGNENVGLLTGDIKTGPNRYILVMTTEILHNMLKNNCPTIHDLEVVIMDEVHYLNDDSRGHIWEQIMILLPKRIQLVMLSATVPNTMEFAEWLGRIRDTQIQIISTTQRPVPLEMFLFTGTGRYNRDQLFRVMDRNKNFLIKGYEQAEEAIKTNSGKSMKKFQSKPLNDLPQHQNQIAKSSSKQSKYQNPDLKLKQTGCCNSANKDHNQWLALFELLKEADNLPVICFLFSRKRIQSTANDLKSLNLLNETEKNNVKRYFKEIISRKMQNLSDKKLPQVIEMQEMLTRGLGMHHAGLLPILKEIVEILFSQGYVKILFATETFAVGVNMPAKSVVFDSIQKHDGTKKRLLLAGEFTQMAGRAGRRGLDKIGNVIIVIKPGTNIYSQDELKKTLIGSVGQLESKFKISYNMILSLYRSKQFNIQHMIRHSFIEADRLKKYDDNCQEYQNLSDRLKLFNGAGLQCTYNNCRIEDVISYIQKSKEYRLIRKSINQIIENKKEIQNFLTPGRIIILDSSGVSGIASHKRYLIPSIILSVSHQTIGSDKYKIKILTHDLLTNENNKDGNESLKDDLLVPIHPADTEECRKIQDVYPKILTVSLNDIKKICNRKIKIDVQNLEKYWMTRFFRKTSWLQWINDNFEMKNSMLSICDNACKSIESANYEKELGIKDSQLKSLIQAYFSYESSQSPLLLNPSVNCQSLTNHINQVDAIEKTKATIDKLQQNLSDENLAFLPEYRNKVAFLKEFEFIHSKADTIKLKGRIACEIETNEIVVTEIILSGVFQKGLPSDIAASLSCIIFEGKSNNNQASEFNFKENPPSLQKIMKEISRIVHEINRSQELYNIRGHEIQINCGLVESIRMWASGAKFSDIVKVTETQCGDIVRCLQRLHELLRNCESAAKLMLDFEMAALFQQTQERIFRGIISSSSLYIDN